MLILYIIAQLVLIVSLFGNAEGLKDPRFLCIMSLIAIVAGLYAFGFWLFIVIAIVINILGAIGGTILGLQSKETNN